LIVIAEYALAYGKYLDLHALYLKYINLKTKTKRTEKIDYLTYLSIFYTFKDDQIIKDNQYKEYLQELCDYLISFFRRIQPLFDLDKVLLFKHTKRTLNIHTHTYTHTHTH
jgi:splicing factor 3A subunit 3